jgi:hypothetical protein
MRVAWRRASIWLLILGACTGPRGGAENRSAVSSPSVSVGVIESVRLEPPSPEILRFCKIAAHELGRPIYCPSLLPANPLLPAELCRGSDTRLGGQGCFRGGAFLMQEVFEGPSSYEGIPASDESASNIGHLNIWSSDPATIDAARLGCERHGSVVGKGSVRGLPAIWVYCPEGQFPPQDSGHIMLQWLQNGVLCTVSLHSDSEENRRLALAIAENLRKIKPG